jgi:predicted transcriptional regulator of viral defense system
MDGYQRHNVEYEARSFLRELAASGKAVFSRSDAERLWRGTTRRGLEKMLARLVRRGAVERLGGGRYLIIPIEAGLAGRYTLPGFVLATEIVKPGAIAFWSALSHHGLTEQIPDAAYVETPKQHRPQVRDVAGVRIRIIQIAPFRFFGYQPVWFEDRQVPVTELEKTLVDGLFLPRESGGMVEVVKGFVEARERIDWDRLTDYALRMKRGAILKRLGVIAGRFGIGRNHIPRWREHLAAGRVLFDPQGPKRGDPVRGWGITLNMSLEGFEE